MTVSVCMASHNGAPFIAAQLASILAELALEDELIVVDDHSSDATVSIIRAQQDSRIKLHQNINQVGHVASFAKAVSLANGDIIALADQDDVWPENRLAILKAALKPPGCLVAAGNFTDIDAQGKTLSLANKRQLKSADSQHWLTNLWGILQGQRPYYGCAMAFKRTLCDQVLPIPGYVESHDLWIAMAGNINKGMVHLDASVLAKRQHGTNVSSQKRRPWQKIVISRLGMLAALITLSIRKLRRGHA